MIPTPTEVALALSQSMEISILAKATAWLLIGRTAVTLARRTRASVRHLMLTATFAALIATPFIVVAVPERTIAIPVAVVSAPIATPSAQVARPASTAVDSTGAPVQEPSRISLRNILLLVWAAGLVLFLTPLVATLWKLRALRRTSLPWPELSPSIQALARGAGRRRRVEALRHETIASPITFGVWRPAILMPTQASTWSEADLRRALVHEMEHVCRGDWAVHLAARTASSVYWFHPLAWIAWRQLVLEAERACDDAVVARDERTDYAEQLVTLAQSLTGTAEPALGMAHRSDLAARVSALLDDTRPRGPAGIGVAALTIAGAVVMVIGLAPLRAIAVTRDRAVDQPSAGEPAVSVTVPSTYRINQRVRFGNEEVSLGGLLELLRRNQPTRVLVQGDGQVLLRDLTQVMDVLKQAGVEHVAIAEQQPRVPRRLRALDRELLEAAENGDLEDVKDLIDAGANIDAMVDGDGSPLIAAVRANRMAVVMELLNRGADVNLGVDGDGSPLIAAARENQLAIVTELLNRGADVNLAVSGDGNPLIAAATEGAEKVVDLLLSRGAAIDLVVPGDENALIQAAGAGHFGIVKMLVDRGADVNARVWAESWRQNGPGGEWRTPLNQARQGGHSAIVAFLLQAGARE
jgi:beta-lactamase regulating signal transducer with metallopeptidase domain